LEKGCISLRKKQGNKRSLTKNTDSEVCKHIQTLEKASRSGGSVGQKIGKPSFGGGHESKKKKR